MSKSNLLPSFSESGSEIESKFVQLNRCIVCTIHFLSQTVKFTLVHFLRVHPSTFFLISESEIVEVHLVPLDPHLLPSFPKNESEGAPFLSSPLSELIHSCPSKKVRVKVTEHFAKSICLFRFPSQKVKFKVHFV